MEYYLESDLESYGEASEIISDAMEMSSEELKVGNIDVKIIVGWTEKEYVLEKLNGVSGVAKYPATLEFRYNSSIDGWKQSLKCSVVHEYAHLWDFHERGGKWEYQWQYVLGEALSQLFSEKKVPGYVPPWREKYSIEELSEYWPVVRDCELERRLEKISGWNPLFISTGGTEYPNWLGYSLAYRIGNELVSEDELQNLVNMNLKDVIVAGNRLFS